MMMGGLRSDGREYRGIDIRIDFFNANDILFSKW